jgi:hypothetical protein
MSVKRSLFLVALVLCVSVIACDLADINPGDGGEPAPPVQQGPTNTPYVPPTFPPTHTSTPALEATATSTPGEAVAPTAESSPTPTWTPPPDGWMAHGALDFHLVLPERWSVIEEQFAGDELKFEAEDSKVVGAYPASVAVLFRYQYGSFGVEEVCEDFQVDYAIMGYEILKVDEGFEINGLPAFRFTARADLGYVTLKEYMYFYIDNTRILLVELYVDEAAWSSYASTFQKIGESFVVD